jgi:hypothetical protein
LVFGASVVSVSERKFVLKSEDGNFVRHTPDGVAQLNWLGGISGSAIYLLDPSPEAQDGGFFMGGFVSQAKDLTVIAVHADLINADGTMR